MPLPVEELRQLAVTLLARRGVPPKKAHLQADHLIEAERDWPSAGRQRLPRLLVRIDRGLAPGATMRAPGKRALSTGIKIPEPLYARLSALAAA